MLYLHSFIVIHAGEFSALSLFLKILYFSVKVFRFSICQFTFYRWALGALPKDGSSLASSIGVLSKAFLLKLENVFQSF